VFLIFKQICEKSQGSSWCWNRFEWLDLKKKSTGESLGKITLSFGVASLNKNEAAEDFVTRADKALYTSKNTGRSNVTGL
jgi:diguanylate cyclase